MKQNEIEQMGFDNRVNLTQLIVSVAALLVFFGVLSGVGAALYLAAKYIVPMFTGA